ncbi:MAG: PEP-CTERM sorting domain-containing protein [Nitrospirae bacterium]|nr:PEP-CTERM sorting domain-containing protein [Nitrospirota bacterium]
MKKLFLSSLVMLISLSIASMAFAITFSEVPLGTTDPTIDGVSFWAGDPVVLYDTFVDDSLSSGNPYLMNGIDDGTGNSPGSYDTFIGVSAPTATLFGEVSFDILSEYQLPGGSTLWLQGLLSGAPVESLSLVVNDNSYHNMLLTFASGADTLYIYDNLNELMYGDAFHIDNFSSTPYTVPPPPSVPEPSTLILLASGLAGAWYMRKRT